MQGDLPKSLNAAALSGLMMNTPYYTDIGRLMDAIDYFTENAARSYTAAVSSALGAVWEIYYIIQKSLIDILLI
jgi:hypothetical protein